MLKNPCLAVSSKLLVMTSFSLVFILCFVWRDLQNRNIRGDNFVIYSKSALINQCNTNSDNSYIISPICNCGKSIAIDADPRHQFNNDEDDKFHWCSAESSVRGKHQKVIAYTLFGNASNAYVFQRFYSLLKNISKTAQKEYPGWTVRIYHDFRDIIESSKTDLKAYDLLCDVYCRFQNVDLCSIPDLVERINISSNQPVDPALIQHLNPRMFRFLSMFDPYVDLFMSRDGDSFIWPREVDAVNEWLNSNYTFHVMRDHVYHNHIILAGMWGVKVNKCRNTLLELMKALLDAGQDQSKPTDQVSLKKILWPKANNDVMAHDSYHCHNKDLTRISPLKVFPFPTKRRGVDFVGAVANKLNLHADKCPQACRPPLHQDWEYC